MTDLEEDLKRDLASLRLENQGHSSENWLLEIQNNHLKVLIDAQNNLLERYEAALENGIMKEKVKPHIEISIPEGALVD